MGCDSCDSSHSNSNSFKIDSHSSSNSGEKKDELETINDLPENDGTLIRRVWITKRTISLNDGHVNIIIPFGYYYCRNTMVDIVKPKINVFKVENEIKFHFKHWATILELSNDTFVNIQFGSTGLSLKEFNKTDVKGENILNAILNTWGEEEHPFSFLYLGEANFDYDELKKIMKEKNEKENESFLENGKIYYNILFNNCQHFACDIEKLLFNNIQFWHSFDYYLEDFLLHFFPDIDMNALKLKHMENIAKENREIYMKNIYRIKQLGINVINYKTILDELFGY
jgi:hypothetical protein